MQASFLPNIFPLNFVPDIALIFVIIWTARSDFNSALKWAILGGLMMDLASFFQVGISIFSFVLIAFIVHSLSKRFLVPDFAWKFIVLIFIVFLATIVNQFVTMFLVKISSGSNVYESIEYARGNKLLWKPFSNLLIFAIIYWPIRRLDKFLSYQNKRVVIKRHA
jgi:rod shape-determining protein MreD